MGDEGFGVRAARALIQRYMFPPGVEVVDGGTGGLALLPLIRTAENLLVIDAIDAGAEPGSIFFFDASELEEREKTKISLHDMGIMDVVNTACLLGSCPPTTIIGVQPGKMDEFGAGLSGAVSCRVERVLELVLEYLDEYSLRPQAKGVCSPITDHGNRTHA
jgi:hydrogenase maturation protease